MTDDERTLEVIRKHVSLLPPELHGPCVELAEHIKMQVKTAGMPVGALALALVGAELAVESAEDNPAATCDECERAYAPDVRIIRWRCKGKATAYENALVEVCVDCRNRRPGEWKYA